MSTSDYLIYQAEMENNVATQKELAEAAESLVPVTQKLEIAFMNLVLTLSPLIEGLAFFMDLVSGLASGVSFLAQNLEYLAAGLIIYEVLTLAAAFMTGSWEIALALASQSLIVRFVMAIGTAISSLYGYLTAASLTTIGTKLLNLAFMTLYGRVFLVIGVLFLLYKIFHKKGSPAFYMMFAVIALGVIALAVALYFIQGPAQVALALLVGLAVGLSMMFYSINLLVNSLTGFFQMLINNVESLPLVAAGLYMMAGAFAAMGIAAALSLGSVVLLLAALTGIGAIFIGGMMLAGFETLGALSGYMAQLGTGMEKFATGLEKIKVVTSLLQQIGKDAFIAVSVKGDTTTAVIAPKDMIPDISNGIDINIKVNVPQPIVYVNIDGKDIPSKVDKARSTPSVFDKAIGNAMGAA